MKKLLAVIAVFCSVNCMAFDSVETKAFAALMKLNPTVEFYDGTNGPLAQAIAPYLISKFDDENVGTLGVLSILCDELELDAGYVCFLTINNTDIRVTEEGDYVRTEDSLESSVIINFTVDKAFKKIKEYRLFYAG